MTLNEYLDEIVLFLKKYKDERPFVKGYVLGLSGGVDSSLVSLLIKKAVGKENMMNLIMPINSLIDDKNDALKLCETCDLPYEIIDNSSAFLILKNNLENSIGTLDDSTLGNLKARIRMLTLYAYAQKNGYLVVGTDNKDERYTGYFTKFGDGAADLLPIAHLLKNEVVEAAKIMGVPTSLADRVPSAGLYKGQTDEDEMGVSYKDLDDFLLGKQISFNAEQKIKHLHEVSNHKRDFIPTPKDFEREK